MLEPGKDFDFFNPHAKLKVGHANLPHWQQDRSLYFTTFRLSDSIPQGKLRIWRADYNQWLFRNPKPWSDEQAQEYQEHFARKIEHWLDQNHGNCLLRNQQCQQIVEDCLLKFNHTRYRLDAFTIATNHVHVLVTTMADTTLSEVLKSWKGVSARGINKALGKQGTIWQKETYDHIVRNPEALSKIRRYIQAHESNKPT
ncbi:MAG: transposase [Opitutaceae bacterium]